MTRLLTPLVFLALIAAACGSTTEVGTTAEPPEGEAVSVEVPVSEPNDEGEEPVSEPNDDGQDGGDAETVITNDVMVDPQVTTPSELILNPEDDTELWVRFIGGDPNCTAAGVTILTEDPGAVQVELRVGITEDALSRSCQAGEFALRVEVPLSEPATGKSIVAVQAATDQPPLVTPELSTDAFLGLTEVEAAALADEQTLDWRVVRIDDEFFAVTEDFRPSRLNFEIEDGIVAKVTLG